MKIAFLTSRFPYPPDRGDRLTVLNILRRLSERHEVTLIAFTTGAEPAAAMEAVGRYCAAIETVRMPPLRSWMQAWLGLPGHDPSQVAFYRSATMRARVRDLIARGGFDLVFNHTIRMARYVVPIEHPAKVLWLGDSLGMALGRSLAFEPWWKRPGIRWERMRVDRFSAEVSQSFRETWALSDADHDDMVRIGCKDVVLIRHGVDERLFDLERTPDPEPYVMFLGNMSVPHNIDAARYAAEEIWPHLHATHPGARLALAGASPTPAVRRLGAIPGVEVTGDVDDLRTLWARAHVLIAPLRFSTGIQNKVLEAMAAGVPVVTTPQVAEAIEARDGEHLRIAADTRGLADAVAAVIAAPAEAGAMCVRARAHVRAHFSWDTAVRRLEHVVATSREADPRSATSARAS